MDRGQHFQLSLGMSIAIHMQADDDPSSPSSVTPDDSVSQPARSPRERSRSRRSNRSANNEQD